MSLQRRFAVCLLLALCGFKAHAQDESDQGYTPPRLSYLEGEVSFSRPGWKTG